MTCLRKLWSARRRVTAGLLLCCALYLGWWSYSFTQQIRNTLTLLDYAAHIRTDTGTLPATFDGHKDYYGRDVVYFHDDEHFMFVSYGSDGEPDGRDYSKLLGVPVDRTRSNCLWPNWDTVVSCGFVWQGCGK
jgi:hypothetical protein